MQAYHRRRHRAMWIVIAILVPILIAIALTGRRGIPRGDADPVSEGAAEVRAGN